MSEKHVEDQLLGFGGLRGGRAKHCLFKMVRRGDLIVVRKEAKTQRRNACRSPCEEPGSRRRPGRQAGSVEGLPSPLLVTRPLKRRHQFTILSSQNDSSDLIKPSSFRA